MASQSIAETQQCHNTSFMHVILWREEWWVL